MKSAWIFDDKWEEGFRFNEVCGPRYFVARDVNNEWEAAQLAMGGLDKVKVYSPDNKCYAASDYVSGLVVVIDEPD